MNTMRLAHEYREGTVTLDGDPTGGTMLYAYCHGPHLLADTRPLALLGRVRREGLPLTVDPVSVAHFLTLGLVPMPGSIFREVRIIGVGDQINFSRTGKGWEMVPRHAFPYFAVSSRQDEKPDTRRLMSLLTESVGRALDGTGSAALMLSSGKDSTAIAAALARLGRRDVRCLTFTADTDRDEDTYARELCARLGLKHERVRIDERQPLGEDTLTDFFRNAPFPCADDCQIPYVAALQQAPGVDVVLDGSGNDVYMGHVPSRNDLRRARLRMPMHGLAKALERVVPYATRADQLLRDPVEHCFMQGLFRRREVSRFFPGAGVDDGFKRPLLDAYQHRDVFDFRALTRGHHYDQGSCAFKALMACEASGRCCRLPWCAAPIIDYYFNLPRNMRFNDQSYTNKVLLRAMLRDEIQYQDQVIGKRYFQFDRVAFFTTNRDRVFDEIVNCHYWEREAAEPLLQSAYRRLSRNPRVGVALNAWFLLSGWLNHNRQINA